MYLKYTKLCKLFEIGLTSKWFGGRDPKFELLNWAYFLVVLGWRSEVQNFESGNGKVLEKSPRPHLDSMSISTLVRLKACLDLIGKMLL